MSVSPTGIPAEASIHLLRNQVPFLAGDVDLLDLDQSSEEQTLVLLVPLGHDDTGKDRTR